MENIDVGFCFGMIGIDSYYHQLWFVYHYLSVGPILIYHLEKVNAMSLLVIMGVDFDVIDLVHTLVYQSCAFAQCNYYHYHHQEYLVVESQHMSLHVIVPYHAGKLLFLCGTFDVMIGVLNHTELLLLSKGQSIVDMLLRILIFLEVVT